MDLDDQAAGTEFETVPGTALDQHTAATTALEEPANPSVATVVDRDEPTGQSAARPTALDEPTLFTALTAALHESLPSHENSATLGEDEWQLDAEDNVVDVLGELRELRAEAESARKGDAEPADASAVGETDQRIEGTGVGFQDESRYMRDQNDEKLHKWKVDYAMRAGAGMALCRDLECLERHVQGGVRSIEKGELRIGRRVLMERGEGADGHVVIMWYHARCIFNTFLRSRKTTRTIESVDDLEGFGEIRLEDQEMLRRVIAGNEDVRTARNRSTSAHATKTPEKRGAPGGDQAGYNMETPTGKKLRQTRDDLMMLKKGDRVWTYCRIRPPPPQRPGEVMREFAVKSPKPELGIIVEEIKDDTVIVQFESEEHEKERIEKYLAPDKRTAKIRAWLRYPRVFEGKKQRLPLSWIQKKPPPKLCGCTKQSWAHECECGISCTRGVSRKVWGVCQ